MKSCKTETGFIYPFTVLMVLLFFMTSIHITQMLLLETKYYEDTRKFYRLQHLTYAGAAISSKKAAEQWTGEMDVKDKEGTIQISLVKAAEDRLQISLVFSLGEQTSYHASYEWSIHEKKMYNWQEW
ncbi:hypothetical protein [Metabacillus sp. 84]|uniref:hypothetical protein n=1 Tax=unclassified Metabacillus TaxID=2675274 RepID=UPI003CE6FB93